MSEPLVPVDCDLQDFPFMPLEVQRLRSSDLAAVAPPAACWYAVLLWCASWHQVPASSLPDDDRVLASFAGFGRNLRGWTKVRDDALRGFTKATDGRFYHPVVAEKALEAWLEKLAQRISGSEGNAKRWGQTFDRGPLDAAITNTRALLARLNPQSRALKKIPTRSGGDRDPIPTQSRRDPDGIARDREGTGKGQGVGVRPTHTRRYESLAKELRRRGLSAHPEAVEEWADFLLGACRIKDPVTEMVRCFEIILEAAKRDGVEVKFSKHAAPYGEHVARTLKAERKQEAS